MLKSGEFINLGAIMKIQILFVALFSVLSFQAFSCSQNEAQVAMVVTSVETDSMHYCKAFVSEESISHFSEHIRCPLTQSEVIAKGIDFPLVNGHDCNVEVGDVISGYLITSGNKIVID